MQTTILRICDANCNRAREALRVLEDYARFSLNHAGLSEQLKQLRHDFQSATQELQARAVACRDAAHDVGTDITTENEQKRESLASVVTAAGKRLGEALRTIEEYSKIADADGMSTKSIEGLRYRFYDIEKAILLTLSPGRERFRDVLLYVLLTESLCKKPWLEVAEAAIIGGADCIQLREKDLSSTELLARARKLVQLCRKHRCLAIINDRPDIAVLSDADGVHVGQDDLPVYEVRKIVGPQMIVGVSTHALTQAQQAVIDGADYIGIGPIFPSLTKPQDILPGLTYARQVAAHIPINCVAISGINLQNTPDLLETGLRSVAVSSAVISADDPEAVARQFKALLTQ